MRRCLVCDRFAVTSNRAEDVASTMCDVCSAYYRGLKAEFRSLSGQSLVALVRCCVFIERGPELAVLLGKVREFYELDGPRMEIRYFEGLVGQDQYERGVQITIPPQRTSHG